MGGVEEIISTLKRLSGAIIHEAREPSEAIMGRDSLQGNKEVERGHLVCYIREVYQASGQA
jgi:hypothetical protein